MAHYVAASLEWFRWWTSWMDSSTRVMRRLSRRSRSIVVWLCTMPRLAFCTNHQDWPNGQLLITGRDKWQSPRQAWAMTIINPLHSKFFTGDKNIYLHFMSFLHSDMTQVVEILSYARKGPTDSTWAIPWVLLSWRRKEPGHQQPWY